MGLRPGEKRAGQLQDLFGLAQLAVLALEFADALRLGRGNPITHAAIALMLLDPVVQRLRRAADRAVYRLDARPLRRVLASVLKRHPHVALTHRRENFDFLMMAACFQIMGRP